MNNAFALNEALSKKSHLTVRDRWHRGSLFVWTGEVWVAVDLEKREWIGEYSRLAVVTLVGEADPDNGLNQVCLACDLEVAGGEWIVDAAELCALQEAWGDDLEVLWEQPCEPAPSDASPEAIEG